MAQLLKLSETAASASAGKRRVVNTGSSFIAVSLSQPVEFTNAFFIAQCLGLRFNSLMKPCLLISALVLAVSFLNAFDQLYFFFTAHRVFNHNFFP